MFYLRRNIHLNKLVVVLLKKIIVDIKKQKNFCGMTSGNKTFDNDATKKLLGFDYQKLVALECCLNAKKNQYIWIECFGDVADSNKSIEIKHHIGNHNLTSNSEDVWKTLKNYSVEYDKVIDFDNLILFTTSNIKNDSIFYDFNDITATKKYSKLKKHFPSDSIKGFQSTFLSLIKKDALKILDKFKIKSEQPKIEEKWKELREHSFFSLVQDRHKDTAIEISYGYITKKAIDNNDKWEICITDFINDLRFKLSPYTQYNIPFPLSNNNEFSDDLDKRNFDFVDKLKSIDIKERDLANAVEDYLKANISVEKLIKISPPIIENLDNYDFNIERNIKDEKNFKSYTVNITELNTQKAKLDSIEVYHNCISKQHDQIINISNTQRYYRNGRIHHIVEETDFEWQFKKEDL